jgi:ethanolamine utilization protein
MSNKELIMKVLGDITTRINTDDMKVKNKPDKKKKNILVLFTGSNMKTDEALDNLKSLKENGYPLTLCFSKSAEEILDIERIRNFLKPERIYLEEDKNKSVDIVKSSNIVMVPVLTQNTLAKVAGGIQDSFISTLLWQLLWSGKKVFANLNSAVDTSYIPCQNKKMLALINSYIDKLKEFGMETIEDHNYLVYISKELDILKNEQDNSINKENMAFKKVITEKDMLGLVGTAKELFVDKSTIITPLARDAAKENNIRIIVG